MATIPHNCTTQIWGRWCCDWQDSREFWDEALLPFHPQAQNPPPSGMVCHDWYHARFPQWTNALTLQAMGGINHKRNYPRNRHGLRFKIAAAAIVTWNGMSLTSRIVCNVRQLRMKVRLDGWNRLAGIITSSNGQCANWSWTSGLDKFGMKPPDPSQPPKPKDIHHGQMTKCNFTYRGSEGHAQL